MTKRNRKKEENVQDVNRFMREVESAMHVDNMLAFWNDHKFKIVSGVVGLFVVVTSWQWYAQTAEKGLKKQADALWSIEQNVDVAPEKYNTIIENGSKGYQTYAWFAKAESFVAQGEFNQASAIYRDIAKNANEKEFAELANLKLAMMMIEKDVSKAQPILKELAENKGVFTLSAKELLAISYEKQNEQEKALKLYENLVVNPALPQPMRQRVQGRVDALNRGA